MKKQICFAGFDKSEVDCLRPELASFGEAWHFAFLPDARDAASTLSALPYDAVVANLRGGGVANDELARMAAAKNPRTLLFVLGDMADREQTSNCIGAAHQFVSRPWKPHELIAIIERSLALDAWLNTDQLRALLPRIGQLPGLSATYFEVVKKSESPHASVESIAEIIARDPALTARLLQVANSPACGLSERVTHPAEAVAILGLHAVKSIVLCLQMHARSASATSGSLSMDQIWRHSFLVARIAHKIIAHSTGGDRMAGDAYTAGLLHRVGQIVLGNSLSSEYAAVVAAAREQKRPLHEVEMEKLGATHNQVGAYLLGVWGLPLPLVEAVAFYSAPRSSATIEFSLLTAVHVAEALAAEEDKNSDGLPKPELDRDYLAKLDLPVKTSIWRKALASGPTAQPPPQPEREPTREPRAVPSGNTEKRPIAKKLAFAAVGLAIAASVAVIFLKPDLVPAVSHLAAAVSKPSDDAPAAPAPASTSPLDSITVQGIFYHADHSTVLINGKTFEPGDQINGAKVVNIEPSQVVLAYMGEQRVFKLK